MPRINPEEKQIYGSADLDQKLTFRERLMKRFEAHEWVRVINVDDEIFTWQYLPTHAEKFEYTPDPMKSTYRDSVEAYSLSPGESEVLIGENAYVMVESLYKKVVSKQIVERSPSAELGKARNFNWNDGASQEDWIDKIVIGKEQPFRSERRNRTPAIPETPSAKKEVAPSRLKKADSNYEVIRGANAQNT